LDETYEFEVKLHELENDYEIAYYTAYVSRRVCNEDGENCKYRIIKKYVNSIDYAY